MKKLLIALTPPGAAALLAGGGTFSSFSELDAWTSGGRRATAPRVASPGTAPRREPLSGIVKTKKVLLAVMAIAAAAYLGTGGTFATFSADTSNNGDSIASGTLTMDNSVTGGAGTGTLCLSANGAVNNNPNCDKVVSLTNVAPGVFTSTATASVQIRNTGSIDATNFYLTAPYVNSTLSAQVSNGAVNPTISIAGLEGAVTSGDNIRLTYGGTIQDFIANGAASGGAITLALTGTATSTFPSGTIVTDTTSNQTPSTTDCYDQLTAHGSGSPGASGGVDLTNFVSATGNPFCRTVVMWVQETTGGAGGTQHYCWYGDSVTQDACTAPVSVTLSSAAACNSTTLPVASLNGNVVSGNTVSVTSGSTTCTFTANQTYYVGATSLSVTPVTGGTTALASGSTLINSSALSRLNSFSTNTVSNFDTLYGHGGKIQLYPVTGNGTTNNASGLVRLSHYNSGTYARTFQIGFYFPAPNGANQNTLQGLMSTFGLTWHIEQ